MKSDLFAQLMRSVGEAEEHARGKRDLRTTVLPEPPAEMRAADIRTMRKKLNASQAVFASCLNVSAQLVRAWDGRLTLVGIVRVSRETLQECLGASNGEHERRVEEWRLEKQARF